MRVYIANVLLMPFSHPSTVLSHPSNGIICSTMREICKNRKRHQPRTDFSEQELFKEFSVSFSPAVLQPKGSKVFWPASRLRRFGYQCPVAVSPQRWSGNPTQTGIHLWRHRLRQ